MQITFIGSDGMPYTFLVKPDDDLRKDSRMMETAALLNRLFVRDPVSRRRNLYIRRCHTDLRRFCMGRFAPFAALKQHAHGL